MSTLESDAGGLCRRRFVLALCAAFVTRPSYAAELVTFENLYRLNGVLGLKFSDHTLACKGKTVTMRGYMAPPLKPESKFFVLTRQPVAMCPFCSSDAEWPIDIVVIYLRNALSPVNLSEKIEVEGTLELGSWVDPQTGFVSQVRIVDAVFRKP